MGPAGWILGILEELEGPAFRHLVRSKHLQLYLVTRHCEAHVASNPSVLIASPAETDQCPTSAGCHLLCVSVAACPQQLQAAEGDDHFVALPMFVLSFGLLFMPLPLGPCHIFFGLP